MMSNFLFILFFFLLSFVGISSSNDHDLLQRFPHSHSNFNKILGMILAYNFDHIDTLVLEVMPISKGKINRPPVFWEQSRLLEQKYAEAVNSNEDMKITDIDEFIKFLNDQLDDPKSIVLEKSYDYVSE